MFRLIAFFAILAVALSFGPATPRVFRSKIEMNMGNKIAAAVFASALAVSPAFAGNIDNGAQVFAGNCAACHAGGNNVIQPEKTLRKEALEQYLEGGFKESSIIYQVTNGKNAMPAFGGRLDEDEIKDVAAYVFDQASGSKWD